MNPSRQTPISGLSSAFACSCAIATRASPRALRGGGGGHQNVMKSAMRSTSRSDISVARLVAVALAAIDREYPNQIAHVLASATDVAPPRALHPAFYGAYDWHSSVHSHWALVRLLRCHPELENAADVVAALDAHLHAEAIVAE